MRPTWQLSRRAILRGAGTSVALPFLDAMVPRRAHAAAGSPPRRFVPVWMFPNGTVGKLDSVQKCRVPIWTPATTGALTTNEFFQPFFDAGLQAKTTVLTGVTDRAVCGEHNWIGSFLWSTRVPSCSERPASDCVTLGKNEGASADQLAAEVLKQHTALPSLVLGCTVTEVSQLRKYISWRTPTQPAPKDTNPRVVFERLFGGAAAGGSPEELAAAQRRLLFRKSVLDSVKADASGLLGRLGRGDRAKLGEYLESVFDIEKQLDRAGAPVACNAGTPPAAPAADFFAKDKLGERVTLMIDLIVKAFECDRTRVATLMYTDSHGYSNYPFIGLAGYHHSMSHYEFLYPGETIEAKKAWMNTYTKWALRTFADLMRKLDARREGDATILDNSILFTYGEAGDAHLHSPASIPLIIGGRGGRLGSGDWAVRAGRHVRYAPWSGREESFAVKYAQRNPGERSMKDFLWGALKALGVNQTSFGDAQAPLDLTWGDAVAS